jgi:hypothetical protein
MEIGTLPGAFMGEIVGKCARIRLFDASFLRALPSWLSQAAGSEGGHIRGSLW